jgi:hypothetical protein
MNLKKTWVSGAIAAGLLAVSAQASAFSTSMTFASMSGEAGAINIDFGTNLVNNSNPVGGLASGLDLVLSGSGGGVSYNYYGGALYNISTSPINSITARPPGSTGNFYSVGTTPAAQSGPGEVQFSTGLKYFGFLWGSPDTYNTVTYFNGASVLGSFTGFAPANGDQSISRYFNAFAGVGEQITRVTFASSQNAFETDNHAYIAAIPEPETYAMMLAGLGLMGLVARRRKQKLNA